METPDEGADGDEVGGSGSDTSGGDTRGRFEGDYVANPGFSRLKDMIRSTTTNHRTVQNITVS